MTTPAQPPDLAERAAAVLFKGYGDQRFKRLAQISDESKPCKLMSGWIESAVADQFRTVLRDSGELAQIVKHIRESIAIDRALAGETWEKKNCTCDPDVGNVPCEYCGSHQAIGHQAKALTALAALAAITGGEGKR